MIPSASYMHAFGTTVKTKNLGYLVPWTSMPLVIVEHLAGNLSREPISFKSKCGDEINFS